MMVRSQGGACPSMAGPIDVVIAGTKTFALALFAPVTERAGARPRIAPEPSVALTLCAQSSGVLVVEYEPRWLPALAQLRQERPALRVVAALARGQESAALALGPLSIDAVPWDGQVHSVMPAIERAIGVNRESAVAPAVAAPPAQTSPTLARSSPTLAHSSPTLSRSNPPIPAGPPQRSVSVAALAAPGAPLDLFTDLGAIAAIAATPSPASMAAIRTLPAPRAAAATWPATGPSAAEAELALRARLAGVEETSSLRSVIDQVVAGLSTLERDVFTGGAAPFDAELIRHAAVLRLRAAAALATRPPPRTPVDAVAVAEFLSEIDGVLTRVKALVDGATPEQRPQLEAIRNALVREAVDFSEACHEIGTAELPLGPGRPGEVASRAAANARFLSDRIGEDEVEVIERKRSRAVWVLLALVVLGAGAFHGYRWWQTEQLVAKFPTLPGQPDGMRLVPAPRGATSVELLPLGRPPDRAQVERFKAQQKLLGKTVTETARGGLMIRSDPPAPGGEKESKP